MQIKKENNNNSLDIITTIRKIEAQLNEIYIKFTTQDTNKSIIEMFPYPSGSLHVGHIRNYIITDVIYRYFRLLQGRCIRAIGWDAFGLPAENAAIENKTNAKTWTDNNIQNMKTQMQNMALLYDWSRELSTANEKYFQYTQEIFIIFFKEGIIFQDYYFINWDPVDQTVLANEQIIDGRGWRSKALVIVKLMKSWFFNLEKYSHYLYDNLTDLKWPQKIISIQKNWIHKHNGSVVKFPIVTNNYKNIYTTEYIECLTENPDQYANVEFICISLNHQLSIQCFLNTNIAIQHKELQSLFIDTKIEAYNSFSKQKIKIYISSSIDNNYGTGAKMFTPTKNNKDKDFAIKFNIKPSIFNNQNNQNIEQKLHKDKLISTKIFFKTKLWCISRQRCWGCPIPLYYCSKCKKYYVYKDINIDKKRLSYSNYKELCENPIYIQCTICKTEAIVTTETLDTFFDSSWYFIRYLVKNNFTIKEGLKLLPITKYIGGIEHANLHLLYTRAIIKGLLDIFNIEDKIPFETIINQGLIQMQSYKDNDKNYITLEEYNKLLDEKKQPIKYKVEKMSKSKKNIINPQNIIAKYSTSALRIMILSNYPIEYCYVWNSQLIKKSQNFVNKLYIILNNISNKILMQKTIENVNNLITQKHKDELKIFINSIQYIHKMLNTNKLNNYIAGLHILFKAIKLITEIENNDIKLNYILKHSLYVMYPAIPNIADYIYYVTYGTTITEKEKENLNL